MQIMLERVVFPAIVFSPLFYSQLGTTAEKMRDWGTAISLREALRAGGVSGLPA